MGKWLIILVDFPNLTDHNKEVDFLWDALAGVVVLNFDVRYRHFTVHGQGPSLIFK
jgi:RNAse (barnase) inhibitor barstar